MAGHVTAPGCQPAAETQQKSCQARSKTPQRICLRLFRPIKHLLRRDEQLDKTTDDVQVSTSSRYGGTI